MSRPGFWTSEGLLPTARLHLRCRPRRRDSRLIGVVCQVHWPGLPGTDRARAAPRVARDAAAGHRASDCIRSANGFPTRGGGDGVRCLPDRSSRGTRRSRIVTASITGSSESGPCWVGRGWRRRRARRPGVRASPAGVAEGSDRRRRLRRAAWSSFQPNGGRLVCGHVEAVPGGACSPRGAIAARPLHRPTRAVTGPAGDPGTDQWKCATRSTGRTPSYEHRARPDLHVPKSRLWNVRTVGPPITTTSRGTRAARPPQSTEPVDGRPENTPFRSCPASVAGVTNTASPG